MIYALIYIGFVIMAWLNVRPEPITSRNFYYMIPARAFFFVDRLLNVTVWQALIILFGQSKKTVCQWETISGRQGRDFEGCLPTEIIDIIALDWSHGEHKGHCVKYIGV